MITLSINGEKQTLAAPCTLQELLQQHHVNVQSVVVERNHVVVPREDLAKIQVTSDDQIEIVQFVGGGKDVAEGEPQPEVEAVDPKKVKKKPKNKSKTKKEKTTTKGPRNLVIVESPAKAKTINKFLGGDFQVEASMGHVRDLPKSKMGVDLENNFDPHYIVIRKASKTVKHLLKQAQGKQEIYLAPDPDREGEAISWHLSHIFREKDQDVAIRRVVFNEITKTAIQDAFLRPREILMNLVNAQQARRILDRIVGYELSPLLWKKVGRGLSAGRVQSVALRLIVDREREIQAFVPQEYWSLEAKLSSESEESRGKLFLAKLDKIGTEKAELKNGEQTEAIRAELENAPFKVEKVDKRERQRRPQGPYTTSKLQQESYNRLGFPAAKTMRVAQKLYEGLEIGEEGSVGLITYMRTDSANVSVGAQQEAADYIRQQFGEKYVPEKPPLYKSKKGAQEAHEAIRPSSVLRTPESIQQYLPPDEFKLYDLIWRKFVGSQMMPAIDEQMTVTILAGEKYFFKASGKRNLFPGFSAVFLDLKAMKAQRESENKNGEATTATEEDEDDIADGELPLLVAGEILKLEELLGHQHFTKPPGRFNDASLVKILEEKGIGRPSTYAPTIFTLLYREYVSRERGALVPTELGFIVVDLLVEHFPRILDIEFTATMEGELDKIEDGDLEWRSVLKEFYKPFSENVVKAREEMKNIRQEVVVTKYTCDVCGKNMVEKWGRFGKFLACPGFPDCKYTRSLPTGFVCPEPNCGGDLVKRKSKKNRKFYGCSNYPKCNYIVNALPKEKTTLGEDDLGESDRQVVGP